jgi:hypothetical protein
MTSEGALNRAEPLPSVKQHALDKVSVTDPG